MRVPVIFADQRRGVVNQEDLQDFIQSRKITSFYRYDEYVDIEADPIRGKGGRKYSGPERRANSY